MAIRGAVPVLPPKSREWQARRPKASPAGRSSSLCGAFVRTRRHSQAGNQQLCTCTSGLLKTDVPRSAGAPKACRQPARVSPKRSATAAIRFTSLLEAPAILLVESPKIGVLSTTGVAEGILGQVTTGVTIAG
jgi:hypothetical protein